MLAVKIVVGLVALLFVAIAIVVFLFTDYGK